MGNFGKLCDERLSDKSASCALSLYGNQLSVPMMAMLMGVFFLSIVNISRVVGRSIG